MELWELQQARSLPLEAKIIKTQQRIKEWYNYYGSDVFISFSGGMDSSVLLTLAREIYPTIPATFFDTGLEFPEVKEHVKTFSNVTTIRPGMTFPQVIKEYGFVYPSKDVAQILYYARRGSEWGINCLNGLDKNGTPSRFRKRYKKWKYLLDSPIKISPFCCKIMKEEPSRLFERETGFKPIIGTLTEESKRREQAWLKTGCNSFKSANPNSTPMSFWTKQDVLHYALETDMAFPSVYGDIVECGPDNSGLLFSDRCAKYKTTGEERTGCMFCLIGCHLDKVNKFQRMKKTHPKIHEYCMNKLGMRDALKQIGVPSE